MRLAPRANLRVDDDGRAHQRHESVIRQALDVDVDFLDVRHCHRDCHRHEHDPEHLQDVVLRDAVDEEAVVVAVATECVGDRNEREAEVHDGAAEPDRDDAERDAAAVARVADTEDEVGEAIRLTHDEREEVEGGHREEQDVGVSQDAAEDVIVDAVHAL